MALSAARMGIKRISVVGIIHQIDHPGFGPKLFIMYQQIQDLLDKIGPYPEKPKKPVLLTGATSDDMRKYADAFDEFQVKFAEFEAQRVAYYQCKFDIEQEVIKLICDESGIDSIPEQYREKVYRLAWQEGHSAGYHEVYQWLCRFVEIFE